MNLVPYPDLLRQWPASGRHILARHDAQSISVYQAYRASIAGDAVRHQRFCGDFSYSRMSWIKPNFLWMMYRSGWGTREGQEHILEIRLRRTFFDELLAAAVASGFTASGFASQKAWQKALAASEVRLQWDPDHDPQGRPRARRALQLGLRGGMLERYGRAEILSITDISDLVAQQRAVAHSPGDLRLPEERVYVPVDPGVRERIGLDRENAADPEIAVQPDVTRK